MDQQLPPTEYNTNNIPSELETQSDTNKSPKEYHLLDETILSKQYPYPGLVQNNIPIVHTMPCSFRKVPSNSTL